MSENGDYVCKLKKALYGLKQAPRAWFSRLDNYLKQQGYKRGDIDNNLYMNIEDKYMIIVFVYVDYTIFGSNLQILSVNFASEMKKELEMSMLGELTFFLGLQVYQTNKGIFISQTRYIKDMLKIFKMEDSKPISTLMITTCKLSKDDESLEVDHTMYRSMIGSLLYVIATRPNVMQAIVFVPRFQSSPKEMHVTVVKRIFQYLRGTMEYGLWYPKSQDFILKSFTDANWEGSVDDRKSTSGEELFLGNCLVSWLSKKQSSISLYSRGRIHCY